MDTARRRTAHDAAAPVLPLSDLAELAKAPTSAGPDRSASLVGSRCRNCGASYFPRRLVCFECGSTELDEHALSRRGVVYSWTTVHVSSSRPTPYTVGYVDLPEGVRVFSTLLDERGLLDFGRPVQLEVGPSGEWAFAPLTDAGAVEDR